MQRAVIDRLELWNSGLQGVRDFPLTGRGMNTFRKLMPIRYPTVIRPAEEMPHAGLIAQFVFGLGDAIPLGAKAGVLFWLTLALAIALRRIALPSTTD